MMPPTHVVFTMRLCRHFFSDWLPRLLEQSSEKESTLMWWVLLLVVIILIVGSLFVFRRDIVAFYPPTNKLYAVLGFGGDVLGSGLEIPDYAIVSR